jgi:UDP-N-acetyl-2-amino-2-deoxyglucuronate dehydrogenase
MNTIKFGIIGCGRIAQRHAEHINNTKGCELVATCDIIIQKAEELAQNYQADFYDNVTEFLGRTDIDVVSICSPNGLHTQHSISSLLAGKHVLCEKPMAISVYDCGEMIKTAEKTNRRLFVIKQNRYNPPVAAVKKLIENNQLGKLSNVQLSCFWNRNENYYANSWKGTKELDGGTLYTQFSHFVDLLYYLIGDVQEVKAFGGNFQHQGMIEFEDTGVVILKFYNGAVGTINYTVNSYKKNMEGSLTIFGEKGTVKIGGQYLNELEYQKIEGLEINNLEKGNKANNYGEYQGSMSNHDKVYENIVQVLQNGASVTTNMFEGLKTVEIIEKIYSDLKKNFYE